MVDLDFDKSGGLIPTIVQDVNTKEVLMLAYSSEKSLDNTIISKTGWFYSRSRNELWNKGSTSGNYLNIKEIKYDCDKDTLLFLVIPCGPACHTGERSCFYRKIEVN